MAPKDRRSRGGGRRGELYRLSPDAPKVGSDLVMLYYLDGFIDAGSAGRQLATHLLSSLEHAEIATFDADALMDYRSRRPPMIFAKDHWESVEMPQISVHLLHDSAGTPFLLLDGFEPDRAWERFTDSVLRLTSELKVRVEKES